MRCRACNNALSIFASTLKSSVTGEYFDMCIPCLKETGINEATHVNEPIVVEEVNDIQDDIDEALDNDSLGG